VLLVVMATGVLSPAGENEQITGATSVMPVGDLNVIGKLDVMIDGYPRIFVAVNTGVGEITFINGAVGQSITIDSHTTDGDRIPLSDTNTLQLVRGQGITINANGYAANHMMNAWLFSDPVQLGNAATNDSGVLRSKFVVPQGPQDGEHTLQLRMVDAEGRIIAVLDGWPTGYLQVTGVGPSLLAGAVADVGYRAAAQTVLALPDELGRLVQSLELSQGGELSMTLSSGTIVRFGTPTDLQNKLVSVVVLLRRQNPTDIAVIDVSTGEVTVAMR
jgi:hypothetical protein